MLNKVVVRDFVSGSIWAHHRHKVINLIKSKSQIQLIKTHAELTSIDSAGARDIKYLERSFQVQILEVKGGCQFIESFVQPHSSEMEGLEAGAEAF